MQQGIEGMSNSNLSTNSGEEKDDHGNELNGCDVRTHPTNTVGVQEGQESMASSTSRTDPAANTGEDDGANSPAVNPSQNGESGGNQESEIQNPPGQVMERPEDAANASAYKIPSHVFTRTNTNTPEWSTNSNESLFSIQMGSLCFSRELTWFKSGDLDKHGDMIAIHSNQPPGNKFNDMSQRTAKEDQGSGVTEAKAAETMREVIRENTYTDSKQELSIGDQTSHSNVLSSQSDHSGHSDISTKSFSFQPLTGDGVKSKNSSSRRLEERQKQQKHSGQLSPKETPNETEVPNSGTKASKNKRLSCLACCPFGR